MVYLIGATLVVGVLFSVVSCLAVCVMSSRLTSASELISAAVEDRGVEHNARPRAVRG